MSIYCSLVLTFVIYIFCPLIPDLLNFFIEGPTNPTWHLEMRDFKASETQYDYCCDAWKVIDVNDGLINEAAAEVQSQCVVPNTSRANIALPKVLIGFGSETGNSEATAMSLARRLKICKPIILSLDAIAETELLVSGNITHFFVVCSTFGAGEPPSNATKFFERASSEYNLKNDLKYAVLALGSSLYPDFCKAGLDIDEMLSESGATSLIDVTKVDDVDANKATIPTWQKLVERLILPISLKLQLQNGGDNSEDKVTYKMKWHGDEYDDKIELSTYTIDSREASFLVKENTELFRGGISSTRSTRHIVLEDSSKNLSYTTGDHLAVKPINSLAMVTRFCSCFSHELETSAARSGYYKSSSRPSAKNTTSLTTSSSNESVRSNVLLSSSVIWLVEQPFYIERIEKEHTSLHRANHLTNKTLSEALQLYIDFSLEHKSYVVDLLSMLVGRVKELSEQKSQEAQSFQLLAENVISQFIEYESDKELKRLMAQYPTIVHLLEKYQSLFCSSLEGADPIVTIADILVLAPQLKRRYYSISSSSLTSPSEVSITVGVLNVKNEMNTSIRGVCSNYLADVKPDTYILASIVESTFRAPPRWSCPVIMIATGTGLAPFMGFMGDRMLSMPRYNDSNSGEWHLYFGCRNDAEVLYLDKLRSMETEGAIKLHLAQSRQVGRVKKYVQNKLMENGMEIARLLLSEAGTHFYICGDVKIAKLCNEACIDILREYGNMSKLAAMHHVMTMRLDGRWQLDVWGQGDAFADQDITNHKSLRNMTRKTASTVWNDKFLRRNSMTMAS